MADPVSEPQAPAGAAPNRLRRTIFRVAVAVVAVAVIAALAGVAGWRLALAGQRTLHAEALQAARDKCRAGAQRVVFERAGRSKPPQDAFIQFDDIALVGTDHLGRFHGTVDGNLSTVDAEREPVTYRYSCSVEGYDADARQWGMLALSV